MSVTSFGSYEGHSSHEYGRDPANPAVAGAGGLPGELADKRVTDWRLALDELGRPIPPPPGHHSGVPDGPAAGSLPDRRSRSGSSAGWEDVTAPPLPPTTLLPLAPAPAARPVPAARTFSVEPSEPFDVTGFDVTRFDAAGFDAAAGRAGQPAALPSGAAAGSAPTRGVPADSLPGLAPPSVSLPSGAFVPASVPVPMADLGTGLTALDDGLIDVEARPTAFAPRRPGQVPAAPDSWDVVVGGDLVTSRPDAVAGPPVPAAPGQDVSGHGLTGRGVSRPGRSGPDLSGHGVYGHNLSGHSMPTDSGGVLDSVAVVGSANLPAQAARLGPTKVALPPVLADLAAAAAAAVQAVAGDAQVDGAVSVDGVTVGAATGPAPLEPYRVGGRVGPADLAARRSVVREQVDYALAEIALAKAAFRRACDDTGRSGWPFRDSELDLLRRPAVAHALARELAGVERLRVWAQELYWLQEQNRLYWLQEQNRLY